MNAPIDEKTKVALEDLLKTAMTSDAVFGDNGDDAKSEQKGWGVLLAAYFI